MVDEISHLNILNLWHLLATGFGSGLSPIVPGTMGSLVAIPLWLLIYWLLPVWLCWFVIFFSFCIGIIICQRISDDVQSHDYCRIVWDEFVGMWLTLMVIPMLNWKSILIAFLLFRFFDILKPWLIGWFDRTIRGGLGIMLDDIIAAIFSILVELVFAKFSPV